MNRKLFTLIAIFVAGLLMLAACTLPSVSVATETPAPTAVPTGGATQTPAATSTLPPAATATPAPTAAPTDTTVPTAAPTDTTVPTAVPTVAPTAVPTTPPTAIPTAVVLPTTVPGAIPHLASGSDVTILQVRMFSTTTGWAIGQNLALDPLNQHVLHTVDGGAHWSDVTPPQPKGTGSGGNGPVLTAQPFFKDAAHAWVGFAGQPGSSVSTNKIWYTSDGGTSWHASAALSQGSGTPEYMVPGPITFLPDGTHGWLMVHAGAGMNHDYIFIFNTSDGGATWNVKVDPNDTSKGNVMGCYKWGMGFVSATTGWLAGSCNGVAAGVLLFKSTNSGSTWTAMTLPEPSQAPTILTAGDEACGLQPPLFMTATDAFMMMTCDNFSVTPTTSKTWIYVTADGGNTWKPRIAPATKGAFNFLNASEGWFVGSGKVSHTTNGGTSWATLTTVTWAGAQTNFISSSVGWAVAYSGSQPNIHYALVKSVDGGVTWGLINPKIK